MGIIHIYPDAETLAHGLAEWFAGNVALTLKTQPRYSFVLSGGHTPRHLYEVLAGEYRNRIEWEKIDFFWGDERYVPFDDERNNGRMAYSSLLTPLGIPEKNIFRMNTSPTPQDAAKEYDGVVRKYLEQTPNQAFDFSLLGMGDDGHTLSVFPGSELVDNHIAWVTNTVNHKENLPRITIMPLLINRSATIAFMISGANKAAALQEVLAGECNPHKYPAQLIKNGSRNSNWFIDTIAATNILRS